MGTKPVFRPKISTIALSVAMVGSALPDSIWRSALTLMPRWRANSG